MAKQHLEAGDSGRRRAPWALAGAIAGCIVALGGLAAYLATTGGGRLMLRTSPPGVSVTVDGEPRGVTADSSLTLDVARAGTISVVLTRAGYLPDTSRILVRRGETVMLDLVMRRPGMVFVRGGRFTMGDAAGAPNERPAHDVLLDAYYIDRTEVTVEAFGAFRPGYSAPFEGGRMPATNVAWEDADAFCRHVGKRLPTEAEWERACRGIDGRQYAYGDTYDEARARTGLGLDAGPAPVGSFPKGNAGALDMTGNVWEWCSDWYARSAYSESRSRNPAGPETGERRTLRGGAWYSNARFARCAHRPGNFRTDRDASFGFRCAASP